MYRITQKYIFIEIFLVASGHTSGLNCVSCGHDFEKNDNNVPARHTVHCFSNQTQTETV